MKNLNSSLVETVRKATAKGLGVVHELLVGNSELLGNEFNKPLLFRVSLPCNTRRFVLVA